MLDFGFGLKYFYFPKFNPQMGKFAPPIPQGGTKNRTELYPL